MTLHIRSDGLKIVIASHGNMSKGMLESYNMIAGENENIFSISLTNEGIESFSKELYTLLDRELSESQVLILTDIKGGTPYNESLRYMLEHPDKVKIVAGMNLPMLIEIGLLLDTEPDFDKIDRLALDIGRGSIELAEFDLDDNDDDLDL